jgi:hypothetical protein
MRTPQVDNVFYPYGCVTEEQRLRHQVWMKTIHRYRRVEFVVEFKEPFLIEGMHIKVEGDQINGWFIVESVEYAGFLYLVTLAGVLNNEILDNVSRRANSKSNRS